MQVFSILAFALFSIVDLRSRFIPFIDIFFVLISLYIFPDHPWHVLALAIIVIWGISRRIPVWLALPFVFYPFSCLIVLVSFGVRKQLIGKADLFAVGIIALLFPISAVIIALLGFRFWRNWWLRQGNNGFVPAIPGFFFGLAVYSVVQIGMHLLHVFPG